MEFPTLFSNDELDEAINKLHQKHEETNFEFIKLRNISQLLKDLSITHLRISEKLNLLIGTAEFDIEIFNLIVDDRGNRSGFEPEVLSILIQLYQRHNEKYGHFEKADKVWDKVKHEPVNIKRD